MTSKKNRCVVVVDRGWIWAGDLTEEDDRIFLDRVVWVFNWRSVGFDGVIKNPEHKDVTLRPLPKKRVSIPKDAEIFRVEVNDEWGL